ncbi:MAG: NADH-quinone oxidoreductase subunit M, partial [Deltaproteobacteria bacterium]|nr:NADH-quinone oxidoreductase subunit M [Deltaproteobacteria bacterium]
MIRPDNVLVWATFLPVIGAIVILALMAARHFLDLPKRFVDQSSRWVTLVASFLMLVTTILAWKWFDPQAPGLLVQGKATGMQMVSRAIWIRPFNVDWFIGVDGLSISMVLLTGIISFVAAISSMPWWQGGAKATHMAGMDEDDHG